LIKWTIFTVKLCFVKTGAWNQCAVGFCCIIMPVPLGPPLDDLCSSLCPPRSDFYPWKWVRKYNECMLRNFRYMSESARVCDKEMSRQLSLSHHAQKSANASRTTKWQWASKCITGKIKY
jgi:hypothetical protein